MTARTREERIEEARELARSYDTPGNTLTEEQIDVVARAVVIFQDMQRDEPERFAMWMARLAEEKRS